jgi:hypothetical protein
VTSLSKNPIDLKADISLAGDLYEVGVVPGEAGGVHGLRDPGAPQRQQPVTARIGVLQQRRLPLVPRTRLQLGQREKKSPRQGFQFGADVTTKYISIYSVRYSTS